MGLEEINEISNESREDDLTLNSVRDAIEMVDLNKTNHPEHYLEYSAQLEPTPNRYELLKPVNWPIDHLSN